MVQLRQTQVIIGSTINLGPHDAVIIKPTYVHYVPTAQEFNLLLSLPEDCSQETLGLGFTGIQFVRPCEYGGLKWPDLTFNTEKNEITQLEHDVYKPRNQVVKRGNHWYVKRVRKPWFSPWLGNQVINFARKNPPFQYNKILSWTSGDMIDKRFSEWRELARNGNLSSKYEFLLEKPGKVVYGQASQQYRVSTYGLRRFSLTFHFWVTCQGNIHKLMEWSGHSRPDTLFNHYIKPPEAIGLTEKMIKKKITIDEFIFLKGKKQMSMPEFFPEWKIRFTPAGQLKLSCFEE